MLIMKVEPTVVLPPKPAAKLKKTKAKKPSTYEQAQGVLDKAEAAAIAKANATTTVEAVTTKVEAPVVIPKVETIPALTATEALTAEYITLYRKYNEFEVKKLCERMEKIKKALQTVANDTVDGAKPAVFFCPDGELEFSPRGTSVEVKDANVLLSDLTAKYGTEVAMSVVKIGITELRKVLSEIEMEKYVNSNPGSRTLKSVRPK